MIYAFDDCELDLRRYALLPLDSCNHSLPERDPAWRRFLAALDAFLAADAAAHTASVDGPDAARPAMQSDRAD